jgi:hypothetical protein
MYTGQQGSYDVLAIPTPIVGTGAFSFDRMVTFQRNAHAVRMAFAALHFGEELATSLYYPAPRHLENIRSLVQMSCRYNIA